MLYLSENISLRNLWDKEQKKKKKKNTNSESFDEKNTKGEISEKNLTIVNALYRVH